MIARSIFSSLLLLCVASPTNFAVATSFEPSTTATSPRAPSHGTSTKRRYWRNTHSTQTLSSAVSVRGGSAASVSDDSLVADAFGWCSNLGAPAALVAGAVIATLGETRGDMVPRKDDSRWRRTSKKMTRFLLLSAFALEIVSIFATTVTGTMLMSHGDRAAGTQAGVKYHSAMGFLRHNHEFEYLTARVTFLQGLFHWLTAVAFELAVPKPEEGVSARRMNQFISAALVTNIFFMISFYNGHMTFYNNYAHMLLRYVVVAWKRFFWRWPIRPMALLMAPSLAVTCFLGLLAFASPPVLDDDNEL